VPRARVQVDLTAYMAEERPAAAAFAAALGARPPRVHAGDATLARHFRLLEEARRSLWQAEGFFSRPTISCDSCDI